MRGIRAQCNMEIWNYFLFSSDIQDRGHMSILKFFKWHLLLNHISNWSKTKKWNYDMKIQKCSYHSEQKRMWVKCAKELLKKCPKYDNRKCANNVRGDGNNFKILSQCAKLITIYGPSNMPVGPCMVSKRLISVKKTLYVIFFKIHGIVAQMPVQKDRCSDTVFFYKKTVLKESGQILPQEMSTIWNDGFNYAQW